MTGILAHHPVWACPAMPQDDMDFAVPVRLRGVGRKVFMHQHWRKSSQWVALVRSHAELVAMDRDLLQDVLFMYPRGEHIQRSRCACGLAWTTSRMCSASMSDEERPPPAGQAMRFQRRFRSAAGYAV